MIKKDKLYIDMRVRRLLLPLFILITYHVWGQESKVFESLSIKSGILNKELAYAIYLPEGYESSQRMYPVLYLLHGAGQNQTSWIQGGDMQRIVDKAIEEGKADPMIIVMPDAERTYYMNTRDKDYQYEDFFFDELMPYIEKTYRCRPGKKYRSIAGLSMGGFGALLYALHRPELFNASAALSAAIRTDEEIINMVEEDYLNRYGKMMGQLKTGESRITDFWNQNSIIFLVKQLNEDQKNLVHFYIDIGDDDFLYKGNDLLHTTMRDLNIPHEYRVSNGSHNWDYFRSGLPEILTFVSESSR